MKIQRNKKTKKAVKSNRLRKVMKPRKSIYKKIAVVEKKVNKISRSIEIKETKLEGSFEMTGITQPQLDSWIFCVNPTLTGVDPKAIVIAQGDSEANRQGNQITTKGNVLKFVACLNPWNSATNANPKPLYLRYYVISIRGGVYANTISDVETIIQNKFFDNGNSSIGFTDSPLDMLRHVNDEVIYVHDMKEFKIGNSYYMASGAGGATPTSAQGFTNNDFSSSVKWTIPLYKYTQKNIKYNDQDTQIFNNNKWVFFTIHNADGSAVGSSFPLKIYWSHNYKFSDM